MPADMNDELSFCLQKTFESSVEDEDTELLIDKIVSDKLAYLQTQHSNISEIRLSKVKSRNYGKANASIESCYCIAFEVPFKGAIPFGEEPLPKFLGEEKIPTDVYEGVFLPLYHPASHQRFVALRMGAAFTIKWIEPRLLTPDSKTATIDPFVKYTKDSGESTTAFISVAHATFSDQRLRKIEAISLEQPTYTISCHDIPNAECFGRVVRRVLDLHNRKDVALIEITNPDRIPREGNFPDSADSFESEY